MTLHLTAVGDIRINRERSDRPRLLIEASSREELALFVRKPSAPFLGDEVVVMKRRESEALTARAAKADELTRCAQSALRLLKQGVEADAIVTLALALGADAIEAMEPPPAPSAPPLQLTFGSSACTSCGATWAPGFERHAEGCTNFSVTVVEAKQ